MIFKRHRELKDGEILTPQQKAAGQVVKTISNKKRSFKAIEYPHYWYSFMQNGVKVCVNTKQMDKDHAKQREAEHRTRLSKGEVGFHDKRDTPTLKEFAPRFLETKKRRRGSDAEAEADRKLKTVLAFKPMADARMDRIDEAMIEKFVRWRSEKVARPASDDKPEKLVSPGTVNHSLKILRHVLRYAQEVKVIPKVPRFVLLKDDDCRRTFILREDQQQTYLDNCPQPLKDVAALILETGLRLSEALNLEWGDVRLGPVGGAKYGSVHIRKGKSKAAVRDISLTPRVVAALKARTRSGRFVFSDDGENPYAITHLDHQHAAVRDKLRKNLPALGWGSSGSDDFVIHSLRHTFLTRLGETGVDVFNLMSISGHSSVSMIQRYVHPTPESRERAFEKLEALRSQSSTRFLHEPKKETETEAVV